MTIEEKVKAYDEMMQRIKELHKTGNALTKNQMEIICPELVESEDEKIRKGLISYLEIIAGDYFGEFKKSDIIAYLEKQKAKERLDRMAPIYNDKESFESALEKAWKYYNESASRTVDSFEDDYIECVFSKGFREGFLYKEKQKEQKPNFDTHWENGSMVCKQKEQKSEVDESTKRFNENWMKQYFDEQKPTEYLSKRKVYDIMNKLTELSTSALIPVKSEEYVKIHEITSDVRSLLDYLIKQKPVKKEENLITWMGIDKDSAVSTLKQTAECLNSKNLYPGLQSSLLDLAKDLDAMRNPSMEWSEEDDENRQIINEIVWESIGKNIESLEDGFIITQGTATKLIKWLNSLSESFIFQPKQEWSEEDNIMLGNIILCLKEYCLTDEINWLKSSLGPQPEKLTVEN